MPKYNIKVKCVPKLTDYFSYKITVENLHNGKSGSLLITKEYLNDGMDV